MDQDGSQMDTDEPTVKLKPMPVDDEDSLILPEQLRVEPSDNLSICDTYPNLFILSENHELSNGESAVIITGFPGIGKTRFLCVLFYLRVAANLPTFYMSDNDRAIMYNDGKYRLLSSSLDEIFVEDDIPENTWCLVDSNKTFSRVPQTLVESGFFIIQAASPRAERIDYVKDLRGIWQLFVMRDWTLSELIVGSTFIRSRVLSEQKMKDFFEKYGGSARHVFKDMDNSSFEAGIDKAARQLEADQILKQLSSPVTSITVPPEYGHMLLSAFPLGDEDRRLFQIRSPSIPMFEKLLKRIGDSDLEARGRVFRICKEMNLPGCKAWVSDILNEDYHSYLLLGQTWPLFAMKKSLAQPATCAEKPVTTHEWKSDTTECGVFLKTSIQMSIVTSRGLSQQQSPTGQKQVFEKEPEDLQQNVYYHPRRRNFATFDSFYVDKPGHALAFQASTVQTQNVNENGVKWLVERGITKITYIYVWPTGIEGWPEVKVPVELEDMFDGFYHLRLPM